jgi:ABC-type polysaccharide/polyol phosphate export permease
MKIFEKNFKTKLFTLTKAEWELRQQSTFLGFMWTLLHPALMFLVIYTLFVKWLGTSHINYAFFLIIGIVQWNYFSSAITMGMTSLLRKSEILKNYKISPETLILSSVMSILISHLIEMFLLLTLVAIFVLGPSIQWFLLIYIEACFLLFICALSIILAKLNVLYNDMERILTIILSAGFFLTPIFYSLTIIDKKYHFLMLFNPMTHIIELTREILIKESTLGFDFLIYMFPIALGLFIISLVFLRYDKSQIMDNL